MFGNILACDFLRASNQQKLEVGTCLTYNHSHRYTSQWPSYSLIYPNFLVHQASVWCIALGSTKSQRDTTSVGLHCILNASHWLNYCLLGSTKWVSTIISRTVTLIPLEAIHFISFNLHSIRDAKANTTSLSLTRLASSSTSLLFLELSSSKGPIDQVWVKLGFVRGLKSVYVDYII